MKTIDKAEQDIKYTLTQMWQLVAQQIKSSTEALITNNKELANEVLVRERIIDNYELQIDKCCEQFTALQNPVAVDLRFVLSHLKMNSNLERIADLTEGLANFVVKMQITCYDNDKYNINSMLEQALRMLELAYQSYLTGDTSLSFKVLAMDAKIDQLYYESIKLLSKDLSNKNEQEAEIMLYLATALRRIERIGDRCTNLAENIIFHLDAKELKHSANIPFFNE